ncbi:MAG: hypothetical protein ACJ788_23885 [Ktedonobacteraceae bacterium]
MDSITKQQNDVDPKQQEDPPPQGPSALVLYQIVTFTVLILGVSELARNRDTTLIYVACAMATAQAGQPIVKNLLLFLKERFFPDNSKKP